MKSFPAKQNLSQWPLPALFLSLFFKIRTQVSEISTHAKHKLQSGLVDVFKHPDRWNSILGTSCLLFFFFFFQYSLQVWAEEDSANWRKLFLWHTYLSHLSVNSFTHGWGCMPTCICTLYYVEPDQKLMEQKCPWKLKDAYEFANEKPKIALR